VHAEQHVSSPAVNQTVNDISIPRTASRLGGESGPVNITGDCTSKLDDLLDCLGCARSTLSDLDANISL